MKIKLLPVLLIIIALSAVSFAQSVVITSKKVTYKRPKPEMEYKKEFTVNYPKVKAATPALSKKIETEISYQKNSELNIQEELKDYQWLETADYVVNYNKNGLLDITLSLEGSGAYPSTNNKEIVVDLKTGNRVKVQDAFTNLSKLAAEIRKMQLAEIKKAKEEYKKDPDSKDFDGSEYFNSAKFGVKEFDEFTVSDEGIIFKYDYGFPHVVLALQPDGTYLFSWSQIKPFIKTGSALAKLVK